MTEPEGELEKSFDIWRDHYDLGRVDSYLLVTHNDLEDDEAILTHSTYESIFIGRNRELPYYDNQYKYTARRQFVLTLTQAEAQRIIDAGYAPLHFKPSHSDELIRGHLRFEEGSDDVLFTAAVPTFSETIRDAYAPPRAPLGEDD